MVIQADTPTSNTEEAEVEWFYDRTNTQERCPFHYRGLECKRNGNPLQCSCLENPRDRVAQSQTRLK